MGQTRHQRRNTVQKPDQKARYDALMKAQREANGCREKTGEVGASGECLRCNADQGEACKDAK